MAGFVPNDAERAPDYVGLAGVFEFTNGDGRWVPFNCGQAAACTLLTHVGRFTADAVNAGSLMRLVERAHPPDNAGGYFGTSRRRVERICRANGVPLRELRGEEELRESLAAGTPVIVMLGLDGPKVWRWTLPAGHWMVAYGFDGGHVYLTNYGRMGWEEFRRRWGGLVPRVIQMRGRGLAAG